MVSSWIPPKKMTIKTMEVHPVTKKAGCTILSIRIVNAYIKPMSTDTKPVHKAILRGFLEKDNKPVEANLSIFFNGYLVSPAKRSFRS